ncbi:MAG: helix-turn-helix transcriptional regulator [Erysipelotrichaceae bacterium]|nr:helix-turn-helix transcriptional regulator [Erysipelotrichaceae bacterium]
MSFGENLQAIRKKNQLSQEELAEMLGVSRQAVSKWELGEGYPEVDKLLVLSGKLNVSLDSLLAEEKTTTEPRDSKPSDKIRIISPHEGVIMNVSKVMRSPQFKGGKNSPKYALFASDGNNQSVWGEERTFLAWYRNLEDVTREITKIQDAMNAGTASYTLQYSVKCKQNLFRTIED